MSEELEESRIPTPLSVPEKREQEVFNQKREETVLILMKAYEEGALTISEYDERVTLAISAKKLNELEVLIVEFVQDLAVVEKPVEPLKVDDSIATELSKPEKITTRLAAPISSQTAIFGKVKKEGPWILSPRVESKAIFGEVQLDLREVEWVKDQAVIECKAVFGSIVVIVPSGVSVDCTGVGILGSFTNRNKTKLSNAKYHLTIRGSAVFGSVEIINGPEESNRWEEKSDEESSSNED